MKNIARNSLAYAGKVTLSQMLGSKKITIGQTHNDGGRPLFDFFANCLMGDFNAAQAKLPRKIGLFIKNDDDTDIATTFGKFSLIEAAKKVDSTADTSTVRYSFSIPYEVLSPIASYRHAYIGLYPEKPLDSSAPYADYLASFSLKDLTTSAFFRNSALIVDWDLQILNSGTYYN